LKTLIKLLVMLAVLNAVARAGSAAWTYYQFRDAVQQSVIFGSGTPIGELHGQILARANELEVPVTAEQVTVQREGTRTWADVSYTQPVELFPRYTYPFDFEFSVDGYAVVGATPGSRR
jgi:hypothetical protein